MTAMNSQERLEPVISGGAESHNAISPTMFEKFCLPYDIRQHELIHALALSISISYHTCGGDNKNNQDKSEVKRTLGSKVKLMGGVDTPHVLPFGTQKQVREQVLQRCAIFAKDGGFVFDAIHNVQAKTPVRNIAAMINAVREFNK